VKTCLAAYTPPGGSYPPFINISEGLEGITFMIRSRADHPDHPGAWGEITVCREVARDLLTEALEQLK
jgi:hypothetical protein